MEKLKTKHQIGLDPASQNLLQEISNHMGSFCTALPQLNQLGEKFSDIAQTGFTAIWFILPLEIVFLTYALFNIKNSFKVGVAAALMAMVGSFAPA